MNLSKEIDINIPQNFKLSIYMPSISSFFIICVCSIYLACTYNNITGMW